MKTRTRDFFASVLAVTAGIVACTPQIHAQDAVRLKVAYGEVYAVSGMTFDWTTIQVKVKNIAYDKDVVLHYRDFDGTWKDHSLSFVGHYGNYDVFGGDGTTPTTTEFVIRYTADGQDYWDNNNGANYSIGTFVGAVGGNVMLEHATARIGFESGGGFVFTTSWFEGAIFVKNLSYHKRVGVRYSADGGATWHDTDGTYAGQEQAVANSVSNVEIWTFKTPTLNLNPASGQFLFAVYFENRDPGPAFGTTYWDNNFSQNYVLNKADGTTLE